MAKIYGFSGKITGKKGDAVFAVRNGENIVRQYNPKVANPNTSKQQNSRSQLKLMSQLSAIFRTIIAIPREGAVSPRNLFTQLNYKLSSVANNKAQINLPAIQLTKSSNEMAPFSVSRSGGDAILVGLIQAQEYDEVVYAVVAKNSNEKLRVFETAVVPNGNPGQADTFSAKLNYTGEAIVVYAYGITFTNSQARSNFGNIYSPTAQDVAQLITSRSLSISDYLHTATAGAYLEVGTNDATSIISGSSSAVPQVPTIGGYSPFAEYTEVILSAELGATIHYTVNGTTPTQASPTYSEPIRIDETTTVKAIAVKNGISSNVSTRTLVKQGGAVVVQAPAITGVTPFNDTTSVTITAEAGATIYYTLDGTNPTTASSQYANAITLSATTTVKAISVLQGTSSAVSTKIFTKNTGGDPEQE